MAFNKRRKTSNNVGHTKDRQVAAFGVIMIPRIKTITPEDNFKLKVLFDDGKYVLYDVNQDIEQIDEFKPLRTLFGLWNQIQLDESRTCVFWNDRIDLPSDTIYKYGVEI